MINSGQELWGKAKAIIPGGNMLLSKRPELYLPEKWPCYFKESKGCKVKDIDGIEYIDMAQMSVGACSLGYANDDVDERVKSIISKGIMSTLNCAEEVKLAEKLISLHPWADMVRFARSGGEANAIAIRIARAASGREKIAICGYHGWHDWYLASNIADESNLNKHLLPGLEANGVPKSLKGTVIPFEYNNIEEFKAIIKSHELAAVKLEVERSIPPAPGFLEEIRKSCTENNIVLIFDECTTGFRETFGGLHLKYKIFPDMAMFGKALGNGYAITSVIGKREVMEAAQSTFISSTFWTERIGPVAALATLELMEKQHSWEYITKLGSNLKNTLKSLATSNDLDITFHGIPALLGFSFQDDKFLKYKTYFTQQLLKSRFLAGTSTYLSTAHNSEVISLYANEVDKAFRVIREVKNERVNIDQILETPICHSGFQRLN